MAADQDFHAGGAGASNFDERALAGLEPAEREAIMGDRYSATELEALKAVAAEGVPATAAVGAADHGLAPVYVAALPADYDDQVTQLKTASTALAEQFKSGEIDVDTYQVEADKLTERREQLGQLKLKADLANDMNEQAASRAWQGTVDSFFTRVAAGGGVDYTKDDARRADLDAMVRVLASRADTVDWPMSRFLAEAHRSVMALHGPVAAPAASPAPAPAPASTAGPSKEEVQRRDLADLRPQHQAAASAEFAAIDALDGDDFEAAIARMPAWQRERYARGG